MSETREVLGVWTFEGIHAPRNKTHRTERQDFLYRHFEGADRTPHFIWMVEFFRLPDRAPTDDGYYGMTLHRYASNAEGSRHRVWVKAYDEYGSAKTTSLVAAVPPENFRIETLPPEWLLLNNPKPKEKPVH